MASCPCCAGKTGDLFDLCEDCMVSSLGGPQCGHEPEPDEWDLLAAQSQRKAVPVEPVRHEHGRAWHWKALIGPLAVAEREGCGRCRPAIPCWRHTTGPLVELVGYDQVEPALEGRCLAGWEGCTGDGGITVTRDTGVGMNASVCESCCLTYLGPEMEPDRSETDR